ncbi:MAG: HlyD family secretion protein [Adhaeribacter sp.]
MPDTYKPEMPQSAGEVGELMARMPGGMVRWGMSAMLAIVLTLLALSWLVKYPDVVRAPVVITTTQPPARVVARASGKLSQLYFRENAFVAAGDVLASIDNPADTRAVLRLSLALQKLSGTGPGAEPDLDLPQNLRLGSLQQDYGRFYRAYQEYRLFKTLTPVARQISATRQEAGQHRLMLEKQQRESTLLKSEVALARKDHARNEWLFKNGVIADKQLEDSERELLRIRRSYEQLQQGMAATHLRLAELQKALTLLDLQHAESSSRYSLNLAETMRTLQGSLALWEQQYLLRAPVAGQVTYLKYWAANQNVQSGEEVMVIVPASRQAIIGRMSLPIQNSGKVRAGQRVHIYLKNFPYEEFGVLRGRVSTVSLVPAGDSYAIDLALPGGLTTSYGKKLELRQEMQGQAGIVTEELRLLERIFFQVRALIRKT